MAGDIFGIKDAKILDAIRFHSTGKKKMSNLAKIIYISDYVELGREYESSKRTGKFIKDKKISLDNLVLKVLKEKLIYLINSSMLIHPDSIELFNNLVDY
jgi:HD superfamily phosphohydrolase YqeK